MKRFEIEHTTRFTYTAPITETMMDLRLPPRRNPRQDRPAPQPDPRPRVTLPAAQCA